MLSVRGVRAFFAGVAEQAVEEATELTHLVRLAWRRRDFVGCFFWNVTSRASSGLAGRRVRAWWFSPFADGGPLSESGPSWFGRLLDVAADAREQRRIWRLRPSVR